MTAPRFPTMQPGSRTFSPDQCSLLPPGQDGMKTNRQSCSRVGAGDCALLAGTVQCLALCPGADSELGISRASVRGVLPGFAPLGK